MNAIRHWWIRRRNAWNMLRDLECVHISGHFLYERMSGWENVRPMTRFERAGYVVCTKCGAVDAGHPWTHNYSKWSVARGSRGCPHDAFSYALATYKTILDGREYAGLQQYRCYQCGKGFHTIGAKCPGCGTQGRQQNKESDSVFYVMAGPFFQVGPHDLTIHRKR